MAEERSRWLYLLPSVGRVMLLAPSPTRLGFLNCRKRGSTYRQGDSDPLQLALLTGFRLLQLV